MKPPLLMLAHRMPYPPDKGEKLRAYHFLRHLAQHHRVFLASFIDAPEDAPHIPALAALCSGLFLVRKNRLLSKLASSVALLTGESLTERYFQSRALDRWVGETIAREKIERAFVFCSAMAPYLMRRPRVRAWVDFVDLDSLKWAQYAERAALPLAWLYRREARRYAQLEIAAANAAQAAFFVTDAERGLFVERAPPLARRIHTLGNGVDTAHFSPSREFVSPFRADEQPIVFTGVMDYPPNEDAAVWFAREVLPRVVREAPRARFYVVGMRPTRLVRALAGEAVVVTGRVEDVRPYLAHAALAVAPLRIARGIQNKVLEAMAMARAVVVRPECAAPIKADGTLAVAGSAAEFGEAVVGLLASPARAAQIGRTSRAAVERHYGWAASAARLDAFLEAQ